jgi:hypothetical protein
MTNAKEELIAILMRTESSIKCANISMDRGYWDNDNYVSSSPILLKEGHTLEEYKEFLNKLDFEYDSGYGGQELYGTVWLMKENTWLSRGEYDGSEWWEYNECPKVSEGLRREDNHYMSTL